MADPLVKSEMRRRMRERNAFWVPVLYLATLLLVFGSGYGLAQVMQPWQLGESLFSTLSYASLLLVALAAPVFSAGAITIEREQRTFASLRMTRLTSWQIVRGKLTAAVLYVLLMASTSLPLLFFTMLLGGASAGMLALHYLSVAAVTVLLASLGILISASFSRSMYAIALTYGLLTLAFTAAMLVHGFALGLQYQLEMPILGYLAFMSPVYYLTDATRSQTPGFLGLYGLASWLLLWRAAVRLDREDQGVERVWK